MNLEHEQLAVILMGAAFLGRGVLLQCVRTVWRRVARAFRVHVRFRAAMKPFAGRAWVIDGDTVEVNGTRVRLFGIDAPEMSQRGGYRSRMHLIGLVRGRDVQVEPVDVDCYGRTVARLRCGESDLSARMVAEGFAVADIRWQRDYASEEAHARRHQLGLWDGNPGQGIADPAAHRRWRSRASDAARPQIFAQTGRR